ncbi:flavin-containing monooxygenase [Paenibacillus sp. 1P07SE]|uniref:flavin-containing monooxygenase n=1 Tax=Paenibacillus sp. 1P07SE TaxID=3132209 RepID=UPI0039A47A4D
MKEIYIDILIIGAGQAGLSMAYHLKQQKKDFLLISKEAEIGEVWRNRYDSLVLFTPRWYSSLPGLLLKGSPEGYATKDEIADYLKHYVETFELPVHLNTQVVKLQKINNQFYIETNQSRYTAKQVIIATGPFQTPFVPKLAASLTDSVCQLHSSNYHNPNQLKAGPVLVVGGGNSGAQIAVELANTHEVLLSVGHKIKYFPLDLMGKSIFWWFKRLGLLDASIQSPIGKRLSQRPDPIFGKELKKLTAQGAVKLKPRTNHADNDRFTFIDGSSAQVANVIWATGFIAEYKWLHISEALDDQGKPLHDRGISPVKGLYFLGLPWLHRRGSALIGGVGDDANYLMKHLHSAEVQEGK